MPMVSNKRTQNAVDRMAQYAVSGFSCMHPHLGEVCLEMGIDSIEVDLLYARFHPVVSISSPDLSLSVAALREYFLKMLRNEGLRPSAIEKAFATFRFEGDEWPSECHVSVFTHQGLQISSLVDGTGNPAVLQVGT